MPEVRSLFSSLPCLDPYSFILEVERWCRLPHESCGCTVPEWPKRPILPGDTDVIKVTYKNTDRPGSFSKYVTIFSNAMTNKEVKLYIKGKILPEPTEALPTTNNFMSSPVNNTTF